jgi:hypothetical protein
MGSDGGESALQPQLGLRVPSQHCARLPAHPHTPLCHEQHPLRSLSRDATSKGLEASAQLTPASRTRGCSACERLAVTSVKAKTTKSVARMEIPPARDPTLRRVGLGNNRSVPSACGKLA